MLLLPGNGARKELDNPEVQGIIIAISKGGSDKDGDIDICKVHTDNPQVQVISKGGSNKYGVSNQQGATGKINILSSPICR